MTQSLFASTAGVLLLKTAQVSHSFDFKLPSQLYHIVRAMLFVMLPAMFVDIYVRKLECERERT